MLEKRRLYRNLKNYPATIIDDSPNSDKYFNVQSIPTVLQAGKTAIKLQLSKSWLLPGTSIIAEVEDINGKVIYSEISNYIDSKKRRIIVIYVYSHTPNGMCTLTLFGNIKYDLNGNLLPNIQPYTVKWKTHILVENYSKNTGDIIFSVAPSIVLSTYVQPFYLPIYKDGTPYLDKSDGYGSFSDTTFYHFSSDYDNATGIFNAGDISAAASIIRNGNSITSKANYNTRTVLLDTNQPYDTGIRKTVLNEAPVLLISQSVFDSRLIGSICVLGTALSGSGISSTLNNVRPILNTTVTTSSYYGTVKNVINSSTLILDNEFYVSNNDLYNNITQKIFNTGPDDYLIKRQQVIIGFTTSSQYYVNNTVGGILPGNINFSGSSNIVALNFIFTNLQPLCGDINKIAISSKDPTKSTDYQLIGTYAIDNVELLIDSNYGNAINYVNSIYRPVGYFTRSSSISGIINNYTGTVQQFTSSYWIVSASANTVTTSSTLYNSASVNYGRYGIYNIVYQPYSASIYCTSSLIYNVPISSSTVSNIPYTVTYEILSPYINSYSGSMLDSASIFTPIIFSSSISNPAPDFTYKNAIYSGSNVSNVSITPGNFKSYWTNVTLPSQSTGNWFFGIMINGGNNSTSFISASIRNIDIHELENASAILNQYWTLSNNPSTGGTSTMAVTNDVLIEAAKITPSYNNNPLNNTGSALLYSTNAYQVYANTSYRISFNMACDYDSDINLPSINVIVSGSAINTLSTISYNNSNLYKRTLGNVRSTNNLRTYYNNVYCDFIPDTTGTVNIGFEILSGIWYINMISLKPTSVNGFTPNHHIIYVPQPTTIIGNKISYKFEYFDNANNQTDYISYLDNVVVNNIQLQPIINNTATVGVLGLYPGNVQNAANIAALVVNISGSSPQIVNSNVNTFSLNSNIVNSPNTGSSAISWNNFNPKLPSG